MSASTNFTQAENNYDFEVSMEEISSEPTKKYSLSYYLRFLAMGSLFGILLVKGEVVSWFRIQEMFRFQSFHMYGVIGSAVVTGTISVYIIKRFQIKSIDGEKISFPVKKFHKGQIFGGLIFGFGWAMTGACPGPLFAQIGAGFTAVIVVLLSAIAGTWLYGAVQHKFPH